MAGADSPVAVAVADSPVAVAVSVVVGVALALAVVDPESSATQKRLGASPYFAPPRDGSNV